MSNQSSRGNVVENPLEPAGDAESLGDLDSKITDLRQHARCAEAVPLAKAALEVSRSQYGAESWKTGDAERLLETVEHCASLDAGQQAELAEADSENQSVARLFDLQKYEEAIEVVQHRLAVHRRLLGDAHAEVAEDTYDLATLLTAEHEFVSAEQAYRKALAILHNVHGREHPNFAQCLNDLAVSLWRKGQFSSSEPLHHEALGIRRRTLGYDHPLVAQSLGNLALVFSDKGDYVNAEPLYREALAIHRKFLGDGHPAVANDLNNLAGLLRVEGNYEGAVRVLRTALAIERNHYGYKHASVAASLNNLGVLLHAAGEFAASEEVLREALSMRIELLGNDHPSVVSSMTNLGWVLRCAANHAQGEKVKEAERLLRDALAKSRKLRGDQHSSVAVCLNEVGLLLQDKGDYAEAEAVFREALAIRNRVFSSEHGLVAESYANLAALLHTRGNYLNAEAMWAKAADSYDAARLRIGPTGLDRVQFGVERSPISSLAACLARNNKPRLAWQRLEANLARGLLDTLSARNATPLDASERNTEEDLIAEIGRFDERIAALLGAKEETDEPRTQVIALRNEQDRLRARFAELQADLSAKYGVARGEVYDLSHIRSCLRDDAALVAWVDLKGDPRAADPRGEHWACAVRSQGEPVWTRLPGSAEAGAWLEDDDRLAQQLREALAQRPQIRASQVPRLARLLHAQRIAPVEPYLNGVRHVIVLPAGWMAGIPVEALTDQYTVSYAPSGTTYAWLVSTRPHHLERRKQQGSEQILVLGDPVFPWPEASPPPSPELPDEGVFVAEVEPDSNAVASGLRTGDVLLSYDGQAVTGPLALRAAIEQTTPASAKLDHPRVAVRIWRNGEIHMLTVSRGPLGLRASARSIREAIRTRSMMDLELRSTASSNFVPLPGTRREVDAIAELFKRAHGDGQITMFLGSEASERSLDALASEGRLCNYTYFHFATHAVMNEHAAMQSAIILSPSPSSAQVGASAAGAEVYDGRLTADQIIRTWKLDAELVALSACDTALGKIAGGEGYLGFSQAFFVSGARSLLLSLWKVDDTATALLMVRFYENLLGQFEGPRRLSDRVFASEEPMPKADALREAKLWLRSLPRGQAEEACRVLKLDGARIPRSGPPLSAGDVIPDVPILHPELPYADPYYWAAFILLGDPQ